MSYGQDGRVGISFQNSYGTANVASLHWLEPISESVDLKKAQLNQKGMRGVYDAGALQEGVNTVEGDLTLEAKANALGVLLSATNVSSLTVSSGAYFVHFFKPRQADHSAPSAERPFTYLKYMGDAGSAHQYSDLNASNLELAISNGELLTAKIGIVGGSYARIAAVAATYSESNPIDWSVSSSSCGGVALTALRSLNITQDNKLQPKHVLDTDKFPARIKRSELRSIEISGTMIFDDQVEYNEYVAQSDQVLNVNLKGTSLVQSGYYESLLIEIPKMRYTEHPLVISGPGEVEVSFKATAQYHAGSGTAISYTLACGKAGF
jgi:hypothetical protein